MMRVLVCGGRGFTDKRLVFGTLDKLHAESQISLLIEGGGGGADYLARKWAAYSAIDFNTYFADWETHGRAAGPIRNQRMLDEGKLDLVVAFPGGRGTADMVRRAKAAGVKVMEVEDSP